MDVNDLIRGDVIFFIRHFHEEGRQDYVDHVAIYCGLGEGGEHLIAHATDAPHNMLCITDLFTVEQGNEYDLEYQVFRCMNEKLQSLVAKQIEYWSEFRVPYDERRLKSILDREEEYPYCDTEQYLEFSRNRYMTEGIFRAIKFASRRNVMPTRPVLDSNGRGLVCTSAVVLSYQVAEIQNHVIAFSNTSTEWVSDKHPRQQFDLQPCDEEYKKYLEIIGYERFDEPNKTSFDMWKKPQGLTPTQYFKKTPSCIAVDSKELSCGALKLYLEEQTQNWGFKGSFEFKKTHKNRCS